MTFQKYNHQTGAVSLLTVIFTMIFISLIVVAYAGVVARDQRQTIDNDLSASALAAANSGIEEGKRILTYCMNNPSDVNCQVVINKPNDCTLFKTGGAGVPIAEALGIDINTTTGEGFIGGDRKYSQSFSCLTIQNETPSISTVLEEESSYIQKLTSTGLFNQVAFTWSGEGSFARRPFSNDLPTYENWKNSSGQSYLPVMQIQLIPYSSSSFDTGAPDPLSDLENRSRLIYVLPCTPGSSPTYTLASCGIAETTPGVPYVHNIMNVDNRAAAGDFRSSSAPIAYAKCNLSTNSYSCTVILGGISGGPGANEYYIKTSLIYSQNTTLKIELMNNRNIVNLKGVQPWIDATGKANDVYRRVRAEVSFRSMSDMPPLPQHVVDSAAPICKDMIVTSEVSSTSFNCN